ncbi:MAG: hypothetical protein AB2A00_21900 [Myxococcota bacterium]
MKGPVTLLCHVALISSLVVGTVAAGPPEHPVVVVIPMGAVDAVLVDSVVNTLREVTLMEVRVDPARAFPDGAYDALSGRYHADAALDDVEDRFPRGAWKALVVTQEELSVAEHGMPDRTLVGWARVRGKSAIVSVRTMITRSHTLASLQRRVGNLVLHEVGHTLGLRHCPVGGCVMADSGGSPVTWADRSTQGYCVLCRLRLRQGLLRPLRGSTV